MDVQRRDCKLRRVPAVYPRSAFMAILAFVAFRRMNNLRAVNPYRGSESHPLRHPVCSTGFSAASSAEMRESSPKSALYCAEPDCRESAFLVIRLDQPSFLRDVVPRSGFIEESLGLTRTSWAVAPILRPRAATFPVSEHRDARCWLAGTLAER